MANGGYYDPDPYGQREWEQEQRARGNRQGYGQRPAPPRPGYGQGTPPPSYGQHGRTASQAPAVPPQFRQDAPPRQDGTRSAVRYGQRASASQTRQPWPLFELSAPQLLPEHSRSAHIPRSVAPPPRQPRAPARRSRPPYPWHKIRFPWKVLGLSSRRRGPSLGRIFYLGTHPIAMLIQLCIIAFAIEIILAWYALVIIYWTLLVAYVTIGWLCLGGDPRR